MAYTSFDDVVNQINEYARKLDSSIPYSTSTEKEFFDLLVNEVVDRALIYMNRDGLVSRFNEDLQNYPQSDSNNDDFWNNYEYYPIPPRLEKPLANVVVSAYKTLKNKISTEIGKIRSLSDNGQSITYEDGVNTVLSQLDETVFNSITTILNRYRLVKTL